MLTSADTAVPGHHENLFLGHAHHRRCHTPRLHPACLRHWQPWMHGDRCQTIHESPHPHLPRRLTA